MILSVRINRPPAAPAPIMIPVPENVRLYCFASVGANHGGPHADMLASAKLFVAVKSVTRVHLPLKLKLLH